MCSLVGKTRSHGFPVQFSPQPYKQLYQHNRGRRGWKESRETVLLEQMFSRCSQLRHSPANPRKRQGWWEKGYKCVMI